jgi:AraC-like DNA-binding protein
MSTPIFNLHDLILIMTIAVALTLALFQPIAGNKNRQANLWLGIFFISLSLGAICILLVWNQYIKHSPLVDALLPYVLSLAALTKGPALYFYVVSLTSEKISLRLQDAWHLLPLVIVWGLVAVVGLDLQHLLFNLPDISSTASAIHSFWYSIKILPLCYYLAAIFYVWRYRRYLKENYSSLNDLPLNWLYALTIGFALTGAWTLLANILGNLTNATIASAIGIAENYFTFILVIAIYIYSISQAQLLIATRQQTEKEPEASIEERPLDMIVKKIRQGVEEDRLYLNPQLNIEEFSRQIGSSYRDVSYAINKIFGTNFFEFINHYRIEEAKRLLADPSKQKMSIMDVLLEAGFNSKSAFQRFFKRLVGVSPTEFRIEAMQKIKADNQ